MSMSVFINGIWISSPLYTQRDSIFIGKQVEERSTASFIIVDGNGTETFTRGMPIMITRPWGLPPFFVVEFAGFIDTVTKTRLSPTSGLLHEIICMDNHYLIDKRLVVKAYSSQTLAFIVNDIWTDYLQAEGITIGSIQTGPTIDTAIFNYVRVSECFDSLKELSGYTWFIDELKQLFFIERATYTSDWDIDMVTHHPIKGSSYLVSGNPLYRNTQYKRGGKGVTLLQTEHFTGDATVKAFTVGFPIARVPDVWVDAVAQTVGIKGIDSGLPYTCYWNKGDATITFDVAPGGGLDIEVQYYGQYPLIARAVNYGAVLDRQAVEGSSGIVEEIAYEAQHDSQAAILESAKATLTTYCQESDKYIYQTYETGLRVGQLQKITDTKYGLTAEEMLIESITITPSGETIYYDVTCVSGVAFGSWVRLFTRILTRQDKTIQIGDELLLVLLQQVEILPLTEATNIHTDAFPPDVYRWIATPPAQGAGHHVAHEALALAEVTAIDSHDTEDYYWDDPDMRWDFFTWA